jgi:hypothetical protein
MFNNSEEWSFRDTSFTFREENKDFCFSHGMMGRPTCASYAHRSTRNVLGDVRPVEVLRCVVG